MKRQIAHISDLHLSQENADEILPALGAAMSELNGDIASILITGDLFDSSTLDRFKAIELLERLCEAIRREKPTTPVLIVPGNHDRRSIGLFGRNDPSLFETVARAVPPHVQVFGTRGLGELIERADPAAAGLPFPLFTYDSTLLPPGFVGAGGFVRAEDLLWMRQQFDGLAAGNDSRFPIVLMMHHHLVPTPLTDFAKVDPRGNWLLGLMVKGVAKAMANGDREEIFMTALGAGTALSVLQALGRPVLVLHGHKHYPTARLLKATRAGESDLLLVSAGSAGDRAPIAVGARTMHLWPSLNRIEIGDGAITVETVAFSLGKETSLRTLVQASWSADSWQVEPIAPPKAEKPAVETNRAVLRLELGRRSDEWDLRCEREFQPLEGGPQDHEELIEGLPGGRVELPDGRHKLPAEVFVKPGKTDYLIRRAACLTRRRLHSVLGPAEVYESVSLPNRYDAARAVLELHGLPSSCDAFGSITDLATGRQIPAEIQRTERGIVLEAPLCPARTLLRIHWRVP